MMNGIPPSEAKCLTYWEYTAMLTEWNARHEAEEKVEAPDFETFQRHRERIMNTPGMIH